MTDAPDLDDGYFRIANAMLPALLAARFRLDAAMVLSEVLAQCWGRSKSDVAVLDVPEIAGRWGLKRPNVWRGLRELKDAGILVAEPGTTTSVRFDKRALVKFLPANIASGLTPYRDVAASKMSVSTVDTASKKAGALTVSTVDTPTVSTVDTQTVSTVDTLLASPHTPLLGEDKNNTRLTHLVGGSVPDSSIRETIPYGDPHHPATADDFKSTKTEIYDGPSMPANFGELTAKADDLFRGKATSFPGLLRGKRSEPEWIDWFRTIPADVWHEALRDLAAVKDSTKWNPGYFLAIVKRQWRDGKDRTRMGQANAEKPKRKETPIPPYRETVDPGFLARREKALRLRQIALGWIKPDESDAAPMEASA